MAQQDDLEKRLGAAADRLAAAVEGRERVERAAAERLADLKERQEKEQKAMAEAGFQSLFSTISPALGAMVQNIRNAYESLQRFMGADDATAQAEKEMARAHRDTTDRLERFAREVEKATQSLKNLEMDAAEGPMPAGASDTQKLAEASGKTKSGGPPILGGQGGAGGEGGAGAAGAEGAAGGMAGGLGAAAGALAGFAGAAMAAVSAVQEIINKIRGFVEAISPATLQAFDTAMRNLNATVGTAFIGVFQQATPIIRQFAGMLMPVMQQLKPIIDQLVEQAQARAVPMLKLFATIIEALLPVLKILGIYMDLMGLVMRPVIMLFQGAMMALGFMFQLLEMALEPVMQGMKLLDGIMEDLELVFDVLMTVIKAITKTFFDFIKSLMPGMDVGKIMDYLQQVTKKVIEAYIWFISTIYKALGLTGLLKNLAEGFKPKHGAVAAVQNTSFKSIEQISKDMALESAKAQGGGEKQKSTEDFLAGLSTMVEDIASGKSTSQLGDWVSKAVELLGEIKEGIDKINKANKFVGDQAKNAVDPFGLQRRLFGNR